jgi:uncharacterized protein YndB with AHSA1/START domain
MATASASIVINQPVAKVFAYVVDAANHTAWHESLLEATVTPDGPVGVGSVYRYVTNVMGSKIESKLEVTAFEENKKWSVTTTGVPTPVETVYDFESEGGGTKLTLSMALSGGYPPAAETAVLQQMQKSLGEQGDRIKKMVES